MGKGDIISWALILGGISVAGLLGYQTLKSVMGNGLFSSTTTFGGEKVKQDIFGNIPGSTQEQVISERTSELAQQSARTSADLAKIEKYDYGDELESAYIDWERELREYEAEAAIYAAMDHWGWTGGVTSESKAQYAVMQKEYRESLVAYHAYADVRASWMAQNA